MTRVSFALLCAPVLVFLSIALQPNPTPKQSASPPVGTVTVQVDPEHPANTFVPSEALGAGVDGYEKGDVEIIYTPENIKAMRSAGFKPLTYRLRTELGVETWHWNPKGRWSDPKRRQGYWTSSDKSRTPIQTSYGYFLPRRGNTADQAGNKGYSRIDDGDPRTFWKSNPYLDIHFTHQDNALHPQWIALDLGERTAANAIRINWGTPFAVRYQVQYWEGEEALELNLNIPGKWRVFQNGDITTGHGGNRTLKLCDKPVKARYFRIMLTQGSGTAPAGSPDVRDRLGFAVREIYLGTVDEDGDLDDAVEHGKNASKQTIVYTSSTDPWHRARDIDSNTEQPGLDLVYRSGLTNGRPMLVPVGLIYDTPENAVAEIRYLRARRYPLKQIEMGEEPDGQAILPEDYAELYVQWAKAIHRIAPELKLGGPGYQTDLHGWGTWPDAKGNSSWTNRFVEYLRAHGSLKDLTFFTFEWYPFDNLCAPTDQQLLIAPQYLADSMQGLAEDGAPTDIPWMLSEYGYSSFAGRQEVDLPGAIFDAEAVAQFLTLGGKAAYFYGYEPNILLKEVANCNTWGNLALFLSDDNRVIRCPLPAYYAARMLTEQWTKPGDGRHTLFTAASDILSKDSLPIVTAYAVRRPDNTWALLLLNKDSTGEHRIRIRFQDKKTAADLAFSGPVTMTQYSPEQYAWHADGKNGHPTRNLPPCRTTLRSNRETTFRLPRYSLTVLQGSVPGL